MFSLFFNGGSLNGIIKKKTKSTKLLSKCIISQNSVVICLNVVPPSSKPKQTSVQLFAVPCTIITL